MNADRGVQIGVGLTHDRGHRPTCRHPGYIHPVGIDVVLVDDLACYTGDERRLAPPALLIGDLELVPTLRHVGVLGLCGIGAEEGLLLGEHVHVDAGGEIVGVLSTTVEHDDQRCRLPDDVPLGTYSL